MSSECYQPDITQARDAFQNMQLMEQEHRPKSKDGERLKTMYEEIVDAQISVLGTPTVRDASKLQVTIIDLDVQRSKVMAWALGVGVELKFQHRTNGLVSSLIDRTLGELAKSKCFRVDELSGLVDDQDLKLMAMACLSIGRKFLEIDESWREEVPGIPREILGVYYKQLLDEPEDVRRLAPEYTVANLLKMEQKVLWNLEWKVFAVTPADIASCVTSQVHTSSRARVTDQTELLIELGWTIGTADWWLREPPTSLALGAVLASIEMCETFFPEFESFVKDSGCTNVRDQSNVFRELFKKARDHQLSLRSDV